MVRVVSAPENTEPMNPAAPYDALLVCSFGGPNGPDDVMPFLQNVTRGRGIPPERLVEVAEHYDHFGGRSPINEQNLALVAALRAELDRRRVSLPVLWGNRNWPPFSVDTLRDAAAFGARRILVLVTSAYASYSGSRQYREHLAAALAGLGEVGDDLQLDILRPFFNDPGFVNGNIEAVLEAAAALDGSERIHLAFVTHSIPDTMQAASAATGPGYAQQHDDVRASVTEAVAARLSVPITSSLSYCSRSGAPSTPWLEPDIADRLAELAAEGERSVVIAPIGFISDHLEVAFDLDVEAMDAAADLGITAVRAATVGTRPTFVRGLVDLVLERAARERGESPPVPTVGALPPLPDVAPPGSCRARDGIVTGVPVIAGGID
jgi:ferrochelatase